MVSPLIKKEDTIMRNAISPGERLAVTLRFLATGDSFMSLQYLFRIPQSTISRIIPDVCDAIYKVLMPEFMKVISSISSIRSTTKMNFISIFFQIPSTEENWADLAAQFNQKWNFPHCIGAVDGKHIVMQSPAHSGSLYYNYKGIN